MRLTARRRAVALLLLLVAAWTGWAIVARNRWTAARAALVAAGEPVVPADAIGPAVPDDRNAADLYLAAAAAVSATVDCPANSIAVFPDTPPFRRDWRDMAAAAIAANPTALALARQARGRPGVDWHLPPSSPLSLTALRYLNGTRALANVLADTALAQHLDGDDAAAFDTARDLLAEADAVDRGRPTFLVCHLVRIGEYALALSRLQLMAPDARIGDGPRDVRRAVVEGLVHRLDDDAADRAAVLDTLRGERLVADDTIGWLGSRLHVLAPLTDLARTRSAEDALALPQLAALPDMGAVMAMLPKPAAKPPPPGRPIITAVEPTPPRYGHLLTDAVAGWTANDPRFFLTEFRCRADRRATAVQLALRLYRLDHHRWPTTLAELVPAYLPAVPLDPIAGGGRRIGYLVLPGGLPAGGDRVLLYWDAPTSTPLPAPPARPWSSWTDSYRGQPRWRDVADWFAGPR